ncbi:MAG: MBL fold metallo-hydrolase [Deltaproteobacteria bacterium]|nr:MBL fold metallo-hydrolase [Deltaproteobacteria bacterium]
MTRRIFIHKMLTWIKGASVLGFLAGKKDAMGFDARSVNQDHSTGTTLSLRELADRKIHHGDGRFLNPFGRTVHGNLWRLLRWKFFSENRFKAHYPEEPVNHVTVDWEAVKRHRGLSVTFLKHASVLIRDRKRTILVDPVFFDLFWFIEDHTPLSFPIKAMPHPHHVLITHGHYDHLDVRSLKALKPETHIISPLGYDDVFTDAGLFRRTSLDWFDAFDEDGLCVTLLPANHWTMRNPFVGPNRALWGSYLVKTVCGPTIFISGDTAYFEGFREIGKTFHIDLAILCLGAYEPRWFMKGSHMNQKEAVRAFRELGAKKLMIVHWGTFRLGDEPVHFPPLDLARELEIQGIPDRRISLAHGGTIYYNEHGEPV